MQLESGPSGKNEAKRELQVGENRKVLGRPASTLTDETFDLPYSAEVSPRGPHFPSFKMPQSTRL